MNNAPQVKIQYLVNYDLEISGQNSVSDLISSDLSPLSDLSNINSQDAKLRGKKGLHLSGGAVDEVTGEVSGTLLDGTYTFYADTQNAYKGIMGDELSNNNYEFDNPQYLTIKTKNANTYIRSLLIYFDPIASEYATEIYFSNAKKYDIESGEIVDDTSFTSAKIYKNDRLIFLHNFGEKSTLTQIQINIKKWSKKNALMKILKIVTGYTGVYDKTSLMSFDFNINKTNDPQQLRFGVSNNTCSVDVLDNDLMIDTLYKKDLIYKNIQVQISVDGIIQGVFYVDEKSSKKGTNEWIFDCVDRLEALKNITCPMMSIAERSIYEITNYVLSGIVSNVVWEKSAKEYCQSKTIEKSYFKTGQTLYDLMLKCCQVGLLRIYIDRNDICKITSGV